MMNRCLMQNTTLVSSTSIDIAPGKFIMMPVQFIPPQSNYFGVIDSHPLRPMGVNVKYALRSDSSISLVLENVSSSNISIREQTPIASIRYIRQ